MGPPSPLLDATQAVLADGKARTADEILAQGQRLGLFASRETRKHIYTALSQYVQRTLGRGRKPFIIEEPDRRFRLNRPVDDWPAIDTTGLPPLGAPRDPTPRAAAVIAALHAGERASDPAVLEQAVCGSFELLGFVATHVGGNDAPDGYADAVLGGLSYRLMLECKRSSDATISQSSAVAEAVKFRDVYHAQFCALVAPSFDGEITFVSELQTHGVSAWSLDDLARAVTLRIDSFQMRDLLAPGFAGDRLDDLAWAMQHGAAKRLRVVASWLVELGLEQQRMSHAMGGPSPTFSPDVALSLLDDRLATHGSTHGVTGDEVDAAFTWLTSPYVGRAVWLNADRAAIVIRPL